MIFRAATAPSSGVLGYILGFSTVVDVDECKVGVLLRKYEIACALFCIFCVVRDETAWDDGKLLVKLELITLEWVRLVNKAWLNRLNESEVGCLGNPQRAFSPNSRVSSATSTNSVFQEMPRVLSLTYLNKVFPLSAGRSFGALWLRLQLCP